MLLTIGKDFYIIEHNVNYCPEGTEFQQADVLFVNELRFNKVFEDYCKMAHRLGGI